ncbi:MAG: hypothetical protein HY892_05320 [Deltaproteobacteria bacterium]|nr:hypothetical protein [Deltaproteobacteria bacterium]
MSLKKAENPFAFTGCWELKGMLGRTAWDERQLLEIIEEIPLDSVYYHTHGFFLRHQHIAGPYPNDFATWAAIQLRDHVLGEKLGILDPFEYDNLESLRGEIINTIDNHLSRLQVIPRIIYGEPFHFMQSRIIAVSTGLAAHNLAEFCHILSATDASVVYFHTFEAMLRLGRREGDFPFWIKTQLGETELAAAISHLDLYMSNLESFRNQIITLCGVVLEKEGENEPA